MLPVALEALRLSSHVPVRAKPLPLGLASLDDVLPERGLPRGSVVEIASARGLGRATTVALSAVGSAQRLACLRSGDARTMGAWCAFVDPFTTLHAPGLTATGVDPTRLLVVRPPADALPRTTLKLVQAKVFAVIVVDLVSMLGFSRAPRADKTAPRSAPQRSAPQRSAPQRSPDKLCNWVRRLAIANEKSDTTVVLLTDSLVPRAMPLPVAMRIDVERRRAEETSLLVAAANQNAEDTQRSPVTGDEIWIRVVKERRGRVRPASKVELENAARLVRLVHPSGSAGAHGRREEGS